MLLKVIIVGDAGVGKSRLKTQFCDKTFTHDYDTTIGVELGARMLQIGGKLTRLQIWDTAGTESFRSITCGYFGRADIALLCFDLTQKVTLKGLRRWLSDVRTYAPPTTLICLVGIKSDLNAEREVSTETAQEFADEEDLDYIECSAKTGDNVNAAFIKAAQEALGRGLGTTLEIGAAAGGAVGVNNQQPPDPVNEMRRCYLRNRGSHWAAVQIFGLFKNNSVEECMKTLNERADKNPRGASNATYAAFSSQYAK